MMGSLDKSQLFKKGKVSILGMNAVIDAFRELTGDKANAKMVAAMRFALKPLRESVKAHAPIKRKGETRGLLKKSIGVKVKMVGRRGRKQVIGMVGPKMATKLVIGQGREIKPYKYAHFVERGTKPHSLKARNPKGFAGATEARGGQHPGSAAKPFLEPALKATGNQIFARFAEKIKEIVKAIVMKG